MPIDFELPDGSRLGMMLQSGDGWQIVKADGERLVLLALPELSDRWEQSGLVTSGALQFVDFGARRMAFLVSAQQHALTAVIEAPRPHDRNDAWAFADSLRQTRSLDAESPLHDAIYVEKLSRLLPSYSISSRVPDDVVFGSWLSGGVAVSVQSFRRLHQAVSWMDVGQLRDVVKAGGFEVSEVVAESAVGSNTGMINVVDDGSIQTSSLETPFRLPGRPDLELFINEHVIDILRHRQRYAALGIGFPGAMVFHGPPGSGKTYAVDRVIEYLGWPSYQVDASSVASPFIHETSRKVAEVFETAQQNAPSVLVIDEMEAFLADRETGGAAGHHRVEEVAEFLRRIPEATKNDVLVVAMTNRIEMIDSAILRRGRFDHIIKVGYASREEVSALLKTLVKSLPIEGRLDLEFVAEGLANRPLSDVSFVLREAARLAARAGKSKLDQESLEQALRAAPAREGSDREARRIGFT